MVNEDPVVIEENIGLSGSETVGVIIAIVSGASVLIIVILLISMGCRCWFHSRRRTGLHFQAGEIASPSRSILRSPSSGGGADNVNVDGGQFRLKEQEEVTSNTFHQSAPEEEDESTFTKPQPSENVMPSNGNIPAPKVHLSQPQPRQFLRDDLMLQEKLGEGEYGPIYRGEAYGLGSRGESKSVTVKMLSPQDGSREMFEQDIEMLSSINHLNVVGLLAICTKDSPECVLLDGGMPGDLLSHIQDMKKGIAPHIATEAETKELLRIAGEIGIGMAYLAAERFIHKDLALRNCIIGFDGVVKIAHFGLGPLIYPEAYYRVNNTDLPIRWMSPEAITSASFTTMSDIWSYGVTIWELFSYGTLPFDSKNDDQVIDFVLSEGKLTKPIKCPNNVFEIVLTCWDNDPKSRPSFFDLHENIAELAGIQSPLSALGPATPVSPISPMTPVAGTFGTDSGTSTFKN